MCKELKHLQLPDTSRGSLAIVICSGYVPPSSNAAGAAARIADCVNNQLQCTLGAPVFILGDLNHCKLELSLPGFKLYGKCGTPDNRVLDKCYGNIRNAYSARPKPPLSNSDHNTVHLIPTYNTVLNSSKPLTKTGTVWSKDSIVTMKGPFLCTDWDIFHGLGIDEATDTITQYIKFMWIVWLARRLLQSILTISHTSLES